MSVLLDGPFCFALAVRQRPRSNLKSHRLLNLTGSLALFSCMECDHNEMGGAEMSLRSKLAVLGLTATLAPFGAQAGESVTYTVVGADYACYSAPAAGSATGLVLFIHDWDGLTGYDNKRADQIGTAHV